MAAETESMASRLCAACGMCCDGTLFPTVQLTASDDPKALLERGMKLKRRKRHDFFTQRCQAFRGSCCSIYAARPERCRVFECRQLIRVKSGETTAEAALEKIRTMNARLEELNMLLDQGGKTDPKRPLAKRCEKVLSDLSDRAYEPGAVELHDQIVNAVAGLNAILDEDFRVEPIGGDSA